jgi:hypothetical protein
MALSARPLATEAVTARQCAPMAGVPLYTCPMVEPAAVHPAVPISKDGLVT